MTERKYGEDFLLLDLFHVIEKTRAELVAGGLGPEAAKGINFAIMVQSVRSRDLIVKRLIDEHGDIDVPPTVYHAIGKIPTTFLMKGARVSIISAEKEEDNE